MTHWYGDQSFILWFPKRASPVSDDALTLVFPQIQQVQFPLTLLVVYVQDALPDARQVPQVEHVVELGRRRQHFDLIQPTQHQRVGNIQAVVEAVSI